MAQDGLVSKGVDMIKRYQVLTVVMATAAVVLTGCENPNGTPNNTGTGALIGGGVGAATGAALAGRNPLAGALVGGILGAITGSLIGNSVDREQAAELQAQAPVTYVHIQQNQPLTIEDVKALVHAKVSDDAIIAQIQNSHTVYHLTASDIVDLHKAGVSDRVVDFMINTASAPPPPSAVVDTDEAPPAAPSETVVTAPGPGYVWINGQWEWNGVAWYWVGGRWVYPPWPDAVWERDYWYRGPFGGWHHAAGHWR